MNLVDAQMLKEKYEQFVVGRPIDPKNQDFLIESVGLRKVSEGQYDVNVLAPTGIDLQYVYKPLLKFLEENNLTY